MRSLRPNDGTLSIWTIKEKKNHNYVVFAVFVEYLQLFKTHRATKSPRADSLDLKIMTPIQCVSADRSGIMIVGWLRRTSKSYGVPDESVCGFRFHEHRAVSGISDLRFKLIKMVRAHRWPSRTCVRVNNAGDVYDYVVEQSINYRD